jgi:Rps23 Pro-64 3,4-dihydroxylase Tpa1-like proline 4-hydroxylase
VDNDCLAGAGKRCNGRRLTAIYYLNRGWRVEEHGGALRILRREEETNREVTTPIGWFAGVAKRSTHALTRTHAHRGRK